MDFGKKYFGDINLLIFAIKEYRRISNIPNGEYSLFDLLNDLP